MNKTYLTSIGNKLFITYFCLALLSISSAVVSWIGFATLNNSYNKVVDESTPLMVGAYRLSGTVNTLVSLTSGLSSIEDNEGLHEFGAALEIVNNNIDAQINMLQANQAVNAEMSGVVAVLAEIDNNVAQQKLAVAQRIELQKDNQALRDVAQGGIKPMYNYPFLNELELLQSIEEKATENELLSAKVAELMLITIASAQELVQQNYKQAKEAKRQAELMLLVLVILSIVIPIALLLAYARPKIIERLDHIVASIRSIAAGNFEIEIDTSGQDEIASMAQALEQFKGDLKLKNAGEEKLKQTLLQLEVQKQALDQFAIVAETDAKGIIIYANKQFCKISEYSEAELIGKNHNELVNSGYHPKSFWKEMWSVIKTNRIWRGDIRNRTKNHKIYWVDSTIVPICDQGNRPTRFYSIRFIITERKEAEERVRRSAEELRATNQELEQFAFVASHDLQEPLRTISSYVQLIEERYKDILDDDAREFMRFVTEGAQRMKSLIQDLLVYSRAGKVDINKQAVDLNQVLLNVLKSISKSIEEKGADMVTATLPTLNADEGFMSQLLQNLISNAIKFTQEGKSPRVQLHYTKTRDKHGKLWHQIAIEDNGIGIKKQYFEKMFLIFQRLHSRAAYPGTGIGLAICKKIVESHGGQLWVESEFGVGSTFFFTLPAEPYKESATDHEPAHLPCEEVTERVGQKITLRS